MSATRVVAWALLAFLCSAWASPVQAREADADEFFHRARSTDAAIADLRDAFDRKDWAAFDRLATAVRPSTVQLGSILLNPHGRTPNETEYAILRRLAERSPSENGGSAFITYWLAASDEDRLAERERWRISARFHMRMQKGNTKGALQAVEPQLASLYDAKFSHQATSILLNYGRYLTRARRYDDAIGVFDRLLRRLVAEKNTRAQTAVHLWMLRAHQSLPHSDDTERTIQTLLQDMRRLSLASGQWERAGRAAAALGSRARLLGDFGAAEQYLEESVALATAANADSSHIWEARTGLGQFYRFQGRLALAEEHLGRVWDDARGQEIAWKGVPAAAYLASMNLRRGHMASALRVGWQIEDALKTLPSDGVAVLGDAHRTLARLALVRGDRRAATEHCERALTSFRTPTTRRGRMDVLGDLLKHDLGTLPQRTAWHDDFSALLAQEGYGTKHAAMLADASQLEGHLGNAAVSRQLADRAAEIAPGSADPNAGALSYLALAAWHFRAGQRDQALVIAHKARRAARPGSLYKHHALLQTAACLSALGRPQEAVQTLRTLAEARSRIRTGVGQPDAIGLRGVEHQVATDGIEAALAWMDADATARDAAHEAAWWFRERGSARLLAEALHNDDHAGNASDPRLIQAVDRVEATHRKVVVALARGHTDRVAALRKTLRTHHDALRAVERRTASGTTPTAFASTSLADFRKQLGTDEAVLAFTVTKDAILGLAINSEGSDLVRLGTRADVQTLLARWKTVASTPGGPDTKLAARAYDTLLRPFEARLANRAHWTVLPEGPLSGIPIDAWIRTQDGKRTRLIETHTISYVHSGSVRAALDARAAGHGKTHGIVALGDPTYPAPDQADVIVDRPTIAARLRGRLSLARLKASGTEATRIAALYPADDRTTLLRADASRDKLLETLAERTTRLHVLHLACHGIVDDEFPTLSGLVFAGGDVLTAERIDGLRVDADLAVLSACDSGSGKQTLGEGVMGLTRSLFLAGVSRVICSTWQVADQSTADLMIRFHERYRSEDVSAAMALREARLSLMRDPKTAHPFYWAGLQLWGAKGK